MRCDRSAVRLFGFPPLPSFLPSFLRRAVAHPSDARAGLWVAVCLPVGLMLLLGEPSMAADNQLEATESIHINCDTDHNTDYEAVIRFGKDGTTSSSTELMRIQEDGYVGIGTSSPVRKLHVAGGEIQSDRYRSSATNVETSSPP